MVTISKELLNIINNYVLELSKEININKVILFGSYAKGTNDENSDIDIAIVTDDFENDVIDEELNLMRLRRKIDTRIEPHLIRIDDYRKVSTPFIQEVIDTGIKVA